MTRGDLDSCPGVLRLHAAADGPLARIRLPGGRLESAQVRVLAEAADELGNGFIELTSRGNVQLRQVSDARELTDRLDAVGLLPSHTHERVRNIASSPLSGLVGSLADVRGLLTEFDAALLADPTLAELPGRLLFTLDDGRGDVSALDGDIGVQATGASEFALLLGGSDTGVRLPADEAVEVLLAAARAFLAVRGKHTEQWRVRDLADGVPRLLAKLGRTAAAHPAAPSPAPAAPIGWLDQDDGAVALGAGVRFGALPARTALFLSAIERTVIVTPWRGLLVTDLTESVAEQVVRVLAPMGLIFDAESPWLLVSACVGQPGCAKALTDVRADAARAVETGRVQPADTTAIAGPTTTTHQALSTQPTATSEPIAFGRQHWSACPRHCGQPATPTINITATPDGYTITPPNSSPKLPAPSTSGSNIRQHSPSAHSPDLERPRSSTSPAAP
ncbi:precorrin-3B synthase [Nocardia callitridis]|uniref:Precorrin-3B synthase n=1 Tax=Nocardia callitridis TaxID=648753 RepID=A0ABP9K9E7_9NOCA